MKLFTSIFLEADLLDHFIAHYENLGVTEFCVVVNCHANPHLRNVGDSYKNVNVIEVLDYQTTGLEMTEIVNKWRERLADPEEWIFVADLDEFHEYEHPIGDLIQECDVNGYNCIRGELVDRIASDGSLPPIADGRLDQQFPLYGPLARNLMAYGQWFYDSSKVTLLKAGHRLAAGNHHIVDMNPHPAEVVAIHHYKWKAGIVERLIERQRFYRERELSWWRESRVIVDYLREHDGRFDVEEPLLGLSNIDSCSAKTSST